jgi:hypothetical protein
MAMAGVLALIGAPTHNDAGAAYIFELQDDVWTEAAKLQASEWQPGDHFGRAVAISSAMAVVGAPHHGDNGVVYLFERQAGGWRSTAVDLLTVTDSAPGIQFGAAVAIAGRDVLVGAYAGGDAVYRTASGAAYLFANPSGETWQQLYKFPQAGAQRAPHFGYAVALTGPYVLIGAPAMLTGDNGYVYPYKNLFADTVPETRPIDKPLPSETLPPSEDLLPVSPPVSENPPDHKAGPGVNRAPRITSTPITQAEILHVKPEITVTDPHLSEQTIALNGQPFTPGTAITTAGSYVLTVEATDAAGNTSRSTVRFLLEPPASP